MDDGERFEQTVQLLAHAILAGLGLLEVHGLLKPRSAVPNIAIMVGMFFRGLTELPDVIEYDGVSKNLIHIVALLMKHGIEMNGLAPSEGMEKYEEIHEKLSQLSPEDQNCAIGTTVPGNDPFSFKREVRLNITSQAVWLTPFQYLMYQRRHGRGGKIGGTSHDITKMSAKERKEASFEGRDPLAKYSKADLARAPKLL